MKTVDRMIQYWRINKVRPYIANNSRVLDIGCTDGAMFRQFKLHIHEGIGIDPYLAWTINLDNYRLIKGRFPDDLPDSRPFDVITMLAVLEHMLSEQQEKLAQDCARFLKPGGCLLITVPSPKVDRILKLLQFLCVIDGMSVEEHHGFNVSKTPAIFSAGGLTLVKSEKFQFGLNNLFIFKKMSS